MALLIALLLASAAWAQNASSQQSPSTPQSNAPPQSQAPPPNSSDQNPAPQSGASAQGSPQSSGNAQAPAQSQPETHITKQQAKELFRSVDEILDFVSQDTGLPIESKVKRNLITREQVEKYVDKRMKDDKDEKRLEQSRLVLQKFGLLPPTTTCTASLCA